MTEHLINKKLKMPRTKQQFEEMRAKTRQKILEHALILFSKKGIRGTSISDIATSAGISKGLAYNYFKNKEELILSVYDFFTIEIGEIFLAIEKISKPKEKIKTLINHTFKLLKNDEKFWRLYINFALLPELQQESKSVLGDFLKTALVEIEKVFKEIGYENPSEEGRMFGAILDGICFHYILDVENYPIEKMRKYLIKKYCS